MGVRVSTAADILASWFAKLDTRHAVFFSCFNGFDNFAFIECSDLLPAHLVRASDLDAILRTLTLTNLLG